MEITEPKVYEQLEIKTIYDDDEYKLCCCVYMKRSDGMFGSTYKLYDINLMGVTECERFMNDGRFINFNKDLNPNDKWVEWLVRSSIRGMSHYEFKDNIGMMVDWISTNTRYLWTINIFVENVDSYRLKFGFEDMDDFLLFKISHS